jgi:hypothetical protein
MLSLSPRERFAVTVPQIPGYVHGEAFREIAETVHFGLRALGRDSILSAHVDNPGRRHIIFGANLIATLGLAHEVRPGSVLYNLEQITPESPWVTPALLELLRAHEVWDYSEANVESLRAMSVHARHVPIGYAPELARIARSPRPDIDVVFCGSLTERRVAILQSLRERGVNVESVCGVYGTERDALLARAKIALNLHAFESKVFEIVRVSYLLANQLFVVSEPGLGEPVERALASGVAFADYDDLVERCVHYLAAEQERREIALQGFRLFSCASEAVILVAALSRSPHLEGPRPLEPSHRQR